MKIVYGDLWRYNADVRCITTNGYIKNNGWAVMGRGVAYQAAVKWPILPYELGHFLKLHGNTVGYFSVVNLITFPVKHNWNEKADIELITTSALELVAIADRHPEWKVIVLPRPGCGNGQLRWSEVEPVLSEILDDRFHIIDREQR